MNRFALRSTSAGFNLLECLIGMAAIGILSALALPSFATLIQKQVTTGTRDNLFAIIQHARSESLARQKHVVICASESRSRCQPGRSWRGHAISFVDANKNRQLDSNEKILTTVALPSEVRVEASRPVLVYRSDGSARGSNLSISVCQALNSRHGMSVVVANSGRARMDRAECR